MDKKQVIALIGILLFVILAVMIILYKNEQVKKQDCIIKGSLEERVFVNAHKGLATWIRSHRKDLGPFFNITYCENGAK